jgi:ATP synthase protein I
LSIGPGAFFLQGFQLLADDRRTDQDELDRRIARAKAEQRHGASAAEGRAESRGWAIGIEFVGAVLVSGFIGWLIDQWAGSAPWVMIALLGLGFAAGTRRALRTSQQFNANSTDDEGKD